MILMHRVYELVFERQCLEDEKSLTGFDYDLIGVIATC